MHFITVPIIPDFLYAIRHQHDHDNLTALASMTTTEGPDLSEFADVEFGFDEDSAVEVSYEEEMATVTAATTLASTTMLAAEDKQRHKELMSETAEVGLMFASKAVVQLIANPFVGPLTNKIGYSIPMFMGFVVMFFSVSK